MTSESTSGRESTMDNRPVARKKNVQEGGTGVARRGEGRDQGPVGSSGGMHKTSSGTSGSGTGRPVHTYKQTQSASRGAKIGGGISLPIIIIGGIRLGVFTATEAGAVAILYAVVLGIIYRNIHFKDMAIAMKETVTSTASIMLISISE